MATSRHIALLRGINVGGNQLVKMTDLRACFEAMGLSDVQTLIASGNVVFSSKVRGRAKLSSSIERQLSQTFGYDLRIVLVTADELKLVVVQAPPGFGKQPDRYRYDVLFVREPVTLAEVFEQLTLKEGVDAAYPGQHALYFRRLITKASQSQLTKLTQRPVYKSITIRNWNTTTKLLTLASKD